MSIAHAGDGDFYIDNNTNDFYLHENGQWALKGTLGTGGLTGGSNIFVDDGPPPDGGTIGQEIFVGNGAPS